MNKSRIEKIKQFLQTLPAGSFGTYKIWKGISKDFRALGRGTRLNERQESVTFYGLCHAAKVSGIGDGYTLVPKIGKAIGIDTGWYFWPNVENKSRRRASLALDIAEAVRQLRAEKFPCVDTIKGVAKRYQTTDTYVGTAAIWEDIAKAFDSYNDGKDLTRCGLCYAGSKSGIGRSYYFVSDSMRALGLMPWPRNPEGAKQRAYFARQIAQALRELEQESKP